MFTQWLSVHECTQYQLSIFLTTFSGCQAVLQAIPVYQCDYGGAVEHPIGGCLGSGDD
jgi:hypothetical protein